MRKEITHSNCADFVQAWHNSYKPIRLNAPENLQIGFVDENNTHFCISLNEVRKDSDYLFSKKMKEFFDIPL